ncbi:MAG: HlyD family efflux transporter periplasmic adaptor subunit [Muribaculaceae bacterium]|nr:HlyD family efflux transporter periplasmic adaptor subunit [Muribaculaceae bacterium]
MDKELPKIKGWRKAITKKALPWWVGGIIIITIIVLLVTTTSDSLRVDKNNLTTATVEKGEFNDYTRVSGSVQPLVSVQLSPHEGGIVQEILKEEGSQVKTGDPILILSNDNLDLQILNAEAELAEKENILRNTMIQMEQQKLSVRQEELQLSTDVQRNLRNFKQQEALYTDKLIPKEDYLKAKEDYELAQKRYQLVKERAIQDSLYRGVEIQQMQQSLGNMRLNMDMIRRRKEKLLVRAPIDGELGLLDVNLGQSLVEGAMIGQINSMDSYKLETKIDEHYIDRVIPGLIANFDRQGKQYEVILRKVYPEVREGKFQADFKFEEDHPENLRRGQTYYLDLQLGQPEEAIIIPRGTFYQKTGGRWIYVIDKNGNKATKRDIKIGRQNPQYYEVTEGLEPGEQVIVSSYERFGDNETLIF